uniref:Uncharacterized protein n=1 Tax=Populus davidiana TaxID=266767 RepID=A0A6M2F7T2_9ROSI
MTVSDCYRSDHIFISLTITSISVITLRPEVPDSISVVLCIALFIKLGVKYLLSAHSTNSFGISTGVTVLAILMYLLLANHALGISIRTPSFFLGKEFILVDFPSTAFGGVASSFLPLIRNDHLT